jgi:hypothetical protein
MFWGACFSLMIAAFLGIMGMTQAGPIMQMLGDLFFYTSILCSALFFIIGIVNYVDSSLKDPRNRE